MGQAGKIVLDQVLALLLESTNKDVHSGNRGVLPFLKD